MIEIGQTRTEAWRTVSLLAGDAPSVGVRGAYGWRRPLTAGARRPGSRVVPDHVERVRRLMAQRASAAR